MDEAIQHHLLLSTLHRQTAETIARQQQQLVQAQETIKELRRDLETARAVSDQNGRLATQNA